MKILVTGGAGYIGSHVTLRLLELGHETVVIDNLSRTSALALRRVEELTGKSVAFFRFDLLEKQRVQQFFQDQANPDGSSSIDAVIHFAGWKVVSDSASAPMAYYENNLVGSINLFQTMQQHGVRFMIFSSSACVYGAIESPMVESCRAQPANPYGSTKMIIEKMLEDCSKYHGWNVVSLRYFNPIGAHPSGRLGEVVTEDFVPNNLLPYIAQVLTGVRDKVYVFGGDYPTSDGSGVRDYIHIMDLVEGHIEALKYALHPFPTDSNARVKQGLFEVINLGTGRGISVLEIIETMREVSGNSIPLEIVPRRPGDVAIMFADTEKAARLLNWRATRTLKEMCQDLYRFQTNNPNGYTENLYDH